MICSPLSKGQFFLSPQTTEMSDLKDASSDAAEFCDVIQIFLDGAGCAAGDPLECAGAAYDAYSDFCKVGCGTSKFSDDVKKILDESMDTQEQRIKDKIDNTSGICEKIGCSSAGVGDTARSAAITKEQFTAYYAQKIYNRQTRR